MPRDHTNVNSYLKCYYTNVDNSLLSKYDELCVITASEHFDVIFLNEIKPKNGFIPDTKLLEIPGYSFHPGDIESPHTRGTCIYVNDKLKASIVTQVVSKGFNDCVWVHVTSSDYSSPLLVGCIYRSGTSATAAKFDKELFATLLNASELPGYDQKLIVGDFNLNKIKWNPEPSVPDGINSESPEAKFTECIRDTYLHQHATEPTRYREGQTPTCDDLIFSSEDNSVTGLTYAPPIGNSDHVSLRFNFTTRTKTSKQSRSYYLYDKGDYKKMNELLNIDWKQTLNDKTPQEAMDCLQSHIRTAVDECIPTRKVSSSHPGGKPIWMDEASLRKTRRKHSSWIRFLNTHDGQIYQSYARTRNAAAHAIRKARRRFEKSIADECKKNNKVVWKYVNSRRKTKPGISQLLKEDGSFSKNDTDTAEVLNEQYYNTFTKEDTSNIPNIQNKKYTSALTNFEISEEAVNKALKQLKVDKSPGVDQLHPRILREMADSLSGPLTIIFKLTLEASELPTQWKDAVITPIFKKGDRRQAANYRPVSLTSVACKIMERLIVDQIIAHIKHNNLGCPEQHGFAGGRSTVTNLLEALNVWTEALMHGLPVDVIFLDYAKAFDTVPHQRLLSQVSSFGVKDQALGWIKSFLIGRRQKVRVNEVTSDWCSVDSGVPQGSVLGPILFTLFVSDIPGEVKNIIEMFADDTKMYAAIVKSSSAASLNSDLAKLHDWSIRMQMRFHPEKCKALHLGSNNPHSQYHMPKSDGSTHTLQAVTSEKDLGVTIDDKLKFSDHVNSAVSKANRVLGALRHSFKYMNSTILLKLYKSMVRPHLEYASCVWSPHLKKDMDAIERVQRRATKLVPELRDLPYAERLRKLQLPTLLYRRKRADLTQTYKILHGFDTLNTDTRCPKCTQKSMFTPSRNQHTRGHDFKLEKPEATGVRTRFYATRVINDWNSLSQNTVFASDINQFKASLRKDWTNHPDKYQYNFSY